MEWGDQFYCKIQSSLGYSEHMDAPSTDLTNPVELQQSKHKQLMAVLFIAVLVGLIGIGLFVQRKTKNPETDPLAPIEIVPMETSAP